MIAGRTIISETQNPFEHIQRIILPDVALTLRSIDGSFMSDAKSVPIGAPPSTGTAVKNAACRR
jgi:hypothetical protein